MNPKKSCFRSLFVGAVAALACAGCANGTLTPQGANVAQDGLALSACALSTYVADTSTTPPEAWQQIAIDLATKCGMDVADIIHQFGASHPVSLAAQASADAVHLAATKALAAKQGG